MEEDGGKGNKGERVRKKAQRVEDSNRILELKVKNFLFLNNPVN